MEQGGSLGCGLTTYLVFTKAFRPFNWRPTRIGFRKKECDAKQYRRSRKGFVAETVREQEDFGSLLLSVGEGCEPDGEGKEEVGGLVLLM